MYFVHRTGSPPQGCTHRCRYSLSAQRCQLTIPDFSRGWGVNAPTQGADQPLDIILTSISISCCRTLLEQALHLPVFWPSKRPIFHSTFSFEVWFKAHCNWCGVPCILMQPNQWSCIWELKKIARICRVGGFNLRVPRCLKGSWVSGWIPGTCELQLCVAERGPWLYLWGRDCCSHPPCWWHKLLGHPAPLWCQNVLKKRILEIHTGLRKVLQEWPSVKHSFLTGGSV